MSLVTIEPQEPDLGGDIQLTPKSRDNALFPPPWTIFSTVVGSDTLVFSLSARGAVTVRATHGVSQARFPGAFPRCISGARFRDLTFPSRSPPSRVTHPQLAFRRIAIDHAENLGPRQFHQRPESDVDGRRAGART